MNSNSVHLSHILVTTDYSQPSIRALQYAFRLAEFHQAKVTVVYVDEKIPHAPAHCNVADLIKSQVQDKVFKIQQLNEFVMPIAEASTGTTNPIFQSYILDGSPAVQIIKFAAEKNIDLIVIATHGLTGLKRFVLGSTTSKVVAEAGCPVLVVRDNEHEFIDL